MGGDGEIALGETGNLGEVGLPVEKAGMEDGQAVGNGARGSAVRQWGTRTWERE